MKLIEIPLIGNYETRKEWEKSAWSHFIKNLKTLSTAEAEQVLSIITTPKERHAILMRAAAADRSVRGVSYRQIEFELWLKPQAVSAIRRAIREKKYLSYYERGKTERRPFPKDGPFPPRKLPAWRTAKFVLRGKGGTFYF